MLVHGYESKQVLTTNSAGDQKIQLNDILYVECNSDYFTKHANYFLQYVLLVNKNCIHFGNVAKMNKKIAN